MGEFPCRDVGNLGCREGVKNQGDCKPMERKQYILNGTPQTWVVRCYSMGFKPSVRN